MKQIYIVYVTYGVTMERIYSFCTEQLAEQCYLRLLKEWINQDQFQEFIDSLEKQPTELTAEVYEEYFQCIEDDAYVGLTQVHMEDCV